MVSSLNFLVNIALFTAYATAGNCRIFLFNKTSKTAPVTSTQEKTGDGYELIIIRKTGKSHCLLTSPVIC